jgi:hypothetical protein
VAQPGVDQNKQNSFVITGLKGKKYVEAGNLVGFTSRDQGYKQVLASATSKNSCTS